MAPLDRNETDWIVQFKESLDLQLMPSDEQESWKKRSIYRVHTGITDLNSKAYQPQVVSFGPYHHGKNHLLPMEEHKRRALRHFIKRSGKDLKDIFESLSEVALDIKESYDALDPEGKVGSRGGVADRFLKMMITDGCFMLEILRTTTELSDYAPNDPIFSDHGKLHFLPNIRRDMLLLENQLPLLVLHRLVTLCDGQKEDEFINRLILQFYTGSRDNLIKEKCLHVLDVFRKSMIMEHQKKDKGESKVSKEIIRSATELNEHGISFEKSNTISLKDISFAGGVLKLPVIVVDEDTESMFLNLIAFERSHAGAGNEVTSYIFFMDNLIDKGQDVALLHTRGIINNAMESDEAAAKLFNSLATGVVLDPYSSLHDVINKVTEYCKKKRHKWRANLIHTYFTNPWVTLSLIAAVFLFVLTIIQTVYAVLGYKK